MKLIRTIKVGNVKLDETHKTGTFKLKQEVKARPEFGTKSTTFDRKTNTCYQAGIFDALVPLSRLRKCIFATCSCTAYKGH